MSSSNPNPRKRAAPGPGSLPLPAAQPIAWDGLENLGGGFVDTGANGAGNGYELIQSQPQYTQNAHATASNSLTRRPMNQALVPARPRANFDGSMTWDGFTGDNSSLVAHVNDEESSSVQDKIEVLEERAQQARREAQAKRKQIPPFVQKLSSFLEQGKNEDLIRWSRNGDSFIVLDEDEFAKTLIPELFKHNNYASFVRQLNMYGFHKRVGLSDNSMRASERKNKSPSEYHNPYFRRGHPNLLWLITKSKSGAKGKKTKNNDGEIDSDEDVVIDDVVGQAPGASNVGQAARSLPGTENQTSQATKKEMDHLKKELVQIRDQQKVIKHTISRLQQTNTSLYNQAMMFQSQHDRHQNSINAILSFLANLFRKSLEEQGNSGNVSDIIQSLLASQNPNSSHQGSVVDLGDFFQSSVDNGSSMGGPPIKRARGLLPPIPAQDATSATPSRSTRSPSSPRGFNHLNNYNSEMGHITEIGDGSPADTPPNLRQELETNPQEEMMRIINDHNATNAGQMDLPEAAEFVASAPSLNQDQRNKLTSFMAQSASPTSNSNTPNFGPTPSDRTSYQKPAMPQQKQPQPRPTQPRQPQTQPQSQTRPSQAPPTPRETPTSAIPSLSPILRSPAMDPVSMNQINHNQTELDQLQRHLSDQDQKISNLTDILGPLSPSGRVPAFADNNVEFDPNSMNFDEFFDFNNTLDDPTFGGVGDDFSTVDFAPGNTNLAAGVNQGDDGPSPAGTEEIARDDFGDAVDHGSKRRRVV